MAGKTYTVEEKYNIVFESLSTTQTIAEICRKYAISPSTFQIWKDQFLTGARSVPDKMKMPYPGRIVNNTLTISDNN